MLKNSWEKDPTRTAYLICGLTWTIKKRLYGKIRNVEGLGVENLIKNSIMAELCLSALKSTIVTGKPYSITLPITINNETRNRHVTFVRYFDCANIAAFVGGDPWNIMGEIYKKS